MVHAHYQQLLVLLASESMLRSLMLLLALLASSPAFALDVVIFDRPTAPSDRRLEFPTAVLRAAMERSSPEFGPYRIDFAVAPMARQRMFQALKDGDLINVATSLANAQWARELLSVQVPVDLGLQCWRIALIDASRQPWLNRLSGPAELKQMRAGVGQTWVTQRVLRENGFRVVSGGSYDGLFEMLMAGRFDYFPRGVNEIFGELDAHRSQFPTLAVEERFLLHDRVPTLFYVSPQAPRLQRRLSAGMESLLKDGTLEAMMLKHFRQDLQRARLCKREQIELSNSELDPALLERKDIWFDPMDKRHGLCPSR
jgi:hypothetical protein